MKEQFDFDEAIKAVKRMNEGDKTAWDLLRRWLKLYHEQQQCKHCEILPHQCARHEGRYFDFELLEKQTFVLLLAQPEEPAGSEDDRLSLTEDG